MNKEKYNDQLIIQYLLGSLSEDEVEKIEELSFIDGDFAVRVNAVENDLVDAYVNGGLSGDTLERFATSYLASPRRRTKVKTAETLRAYARKEARQELQAVFAPDQPLKRERSLTRPPFPFRRFALTAAAVLVSLLAGWLLFEVTRLRTRIDQAQEMIEQQRSAQAALEQELRRVREEKEQIEEQKEGRAGSPSAPANPKITTFLLTMPARAADRVQEITIPSGTDYVLL
ncbi:MAG: hypothetical protein J2P31_14345, partial [Blastocatellia bacterium]|nr:hypothetical protein [Blastocatellia bacterium]